MGWEGLPLYSECSTCLDAPMGLAGWMKKLNWRQLKDEIKTCQRNISWNNHSTKWKVFHFENDILLSSSVESNFDFSFSPVHNIPLLMLNWSISILAAVIWRDIYTVFYSPAAPARPVISNEQQLWERKSAALMINHELVLRQYIFDKL